MRVLAMYLPQYHQIKENDEWWGTGYTEWTAVKNAVSYSKKQKQPRVPLDNNYYDLSDLEAKAWKWQAELAKKYGVYGFAIYHYWFNTGKQLLQKPMEILLNHKEIDLNYCICWANETWSRTWYGTENDILLKQEYGDEQEWINHFNYLLPFFQDKRYIKVDNKPMINIYHSYEIENLNEMIKKWNELARENGFNGVYIVSGNTGAKIDERRDLFDAYYNFEPSYTMMHKTNKFERFEYLLKVFLRSNFNKVFKKKIIERPMSGKAFLNRMLRTDVLENVKINPGVFPQWDNSPRRQYKGTVFTGMSKDLFQRQVKQTCEKYKEADFLYVNAWNEWGEGAYLEPDMHNKYMYLEVIKSEIQNKDK